MENLSHPGYKIRRGPIQGKYISEEQKVRKEKMDRALQQVEELLQQYELTIPDLYREHIYRVRNASKIYRPTAS